MKCMNHNWGDTRAQWPSGLECWILVWKPNMLLRWGFNSRPVQEISGRFVLLIQQYKLSGLSDETLKTKVPCTGSYPQACKRSQTVCRKSRGLPRLYWTSQFFSRGKHLMADELCAIHVKYIKFKKKKTSQIIFKVGVFFYWHINLNLIKIYVSTEN